VPVLTVVIGIVGSKTFDNQNAIDDLRLALRQAKDAKESLGELLLKSTAINSSLAISLDAAVILNETLTTLGLNSSTIAAGMQSLQRSLDSVNMTVQSTQTSVVVMNASMRSAEASLRSINASVESTSAEIKTAEQELIAVNSSVEATRGSVLTVNASLEATKLNLKAVNDSVEVTRTSLLSVNSSVEATRGSLVAINASITSTRAEVQTVNASVPRLIGLYTVNNSGTSFSTDCNTPTLAAVNNQRFGEIPTVPGRTYLVIFNAKIATRCTSFKMGYIIDHANPDDPTPANEIAVSPYVTIGNENGIDTYSAVFTFQGQHRIILTSYGCSCVPACNFETGVCPKHVLSTISLMEFQ